MLACTGFLVLGLFALAVECDSTQSQTPGVIHGRVLTPPYFNLAEGRRITASATCGYGVSEPELYCKLVGTHADPKDNPNVNLIQGQVCDFCDPNNPELDHSPENAIDGTERWWQSPPLSRGTIYNNVNFTIDLGQEFHVAYVFIKMANSPRPGIWSLERSTDYGETWEPWQYFADTYSDCVTYFGRKSLEPITRDDSVICETKFSKIVPLEGGEIVVSLLNDRPSANNFYNSTVLQEWTKATNIRLRLIRTKTLLGHLMSVARQDPTVTRRYYYSIRDISVGGRCVCNGHAETCDITDPEDRFKLLCRCQHNTCGSQCEKCCPGFVQKKWQPATFSNTNECEECNCLGHSDECEYDEEVDRLGLSLDKNGEFAGGGMCKNCQHNTEGINCNKCKTGYFRPYGKPLNATDVCQRCQCDVFYSTGSCAEGSGHCECREEFLPPLCDQCNFGYYDYPNCKQCDCHMNGTRGFKCEVGGGQCPCKPNYTGKNCDKCIDEYFNFPECTACDCNLNGSLSTTCDPKTGQCLCHNNYGGRTCSDCDDGFYDYPICKFCSCDRTGCVPEVCNKKTGECLCKEGFGGPQCDRCAPGFYGYPQCKSCNCNEHGSLSTYCDESGKCPCLHNFVGLTCHQCAAGYYNYPECTSCNCDSAGANGISCDKDGRCQCKPNFDGITCNSCKQGFYNYPACEECNCNPAGVLPTFAGCGTLPVGELCQCKERVGGRACNQCRALFWNLKLYNPQGCEECNCFVSGTIGGIGTCDGTSGQCLCKPNAASRQCSECRDGTFNLQEENLFGCIDCQCDIGGSVNQICDKQTGQCACRPRIDGRSCNKPKMRHYYPTLYQLQYEIEDGHTVTHGPVRFGYNSEDFPGYSWRGYAVFSPLQKEVQIKIAVIKSSIYRVVLRYFNKQPDVIKGQISFTPDMPGGDIPQSSVVKYEVSDSPQFVTVYNTDSSSPYPFVLNPGDWTATIKVEKPLLLDYFILLPAEYYEASLLHDVITTPCTIDLEVAKCRQYSYPLVDDFAIVRGKAGYVADGDERKPTQIYYNYQLQEKLNIDGEMAHLNKQQHDVRLEIELPKTGRYALVVIYFTPNSSEMATVHIDTSSTTGRQKGRVILYECRLTTLCRQAVTDAHGRVIMFNFDQNSITLHLKTSHNADVAVDSVVAIPAKQWHVDFISPKVACLQIGGSCSESKFNVAPGFVKIEAETGNEKQRAVKLPFDSFDTNIGLIYLDHKDPMLDIHGQVPRSGAYVFVIHFYQPRFPEFDMDVLIQNGQVYEGILPIPFCPSESGCRSVVKTKDGEYEFQILERFVLTLKEPNHKSVWVDYVMAIPAGSYKSEVLQEMPVDRSLDFITQCGQHHFFVDPESNNEEFCKDAIFSLTTEYNNGGLHCQCDFDGSKDLDCNVFGGQCNCKPNIIGRTCSECQTGYFGFPDCQPCSCPSTALCDPVTGDCICPPRVTGEKCDSCIANTYGFDPIIGCEECNCDPLGVKQGDLQCDLLIGQCSCKPNVVGRTCDSCQPGYWSFPYCQLCDCDHRGTSDDICDMDTAQCFCKENVFGPTCDQCKPGSFHLEEKNPLGCSKCFCFGRTDRCSSSTMFRSQILEIEEWATVLLQEGTLALEEGDSPVVINTNENRIVAHISEDFPRDNVLYFSAPFEYLGNKITSYGGMLSYNLKFDLQNEMTSSVLSPDVIFVGNNMTLLYQHFEQPSPTDPFQVDMEITERAFYHANGGPVTREQLLICLSNLDALYIKGLYFTESKEISLKQVLLDVTVSQYLADAPQALNVEQCHCPPNYQGSSCEDCAPGYYRSTTGPYGGYCIPCQCNGHSNICDSLNGKCIDCRHNTTGDHCEKCVAGFHGDATVGTPYDCLICACPLPLVSNNFAESCEFSPSGLEIRCECKPGYFGPRCNYCGAGYYGQPEIPGDMCRPCECSGNIDSTSFGSCDSLTGDCLQCLNNTYGAACELCAPGFYGDAVDSKDCKSCDCDRCGTRSCHHSTGLCNCHPNIVGQRCNECLSGYWGFDSCEGCIACNCGVASESNQCDSKTGQCECKPGVIGRTCNQCKAGYWNYGPLGCKACDCNQEYSIGGSCNPTTGQCECLPGVVGDQCNQCPHRWVLVENVGCHECGKCVHVLLDDFEELLRFELDPHITELEGVSLGYFAYQRLKYFNQTVNELWPLVGLLIYDPSAVDLRPWDLQLSNLERESKQYDREAKNSLNTAENKSSIAEGLRDEALALEKKIQDTIKFAAGVVKDVQNLAHQIITTHGPDVDSKIEEAQGLLNEIERRNFDHPKEKCDLEDGMANETLKRALNFSLPIDKNLKEIEALKDQLVNIKAKLLELANTSMESMKNSQETQDLIEPRKYVQLKHKLDAAEKSLEMTGEILKEATDILQKARALLTEAKDGFPNIIDPSILDNLQRKTEELRKKSESLTNDLEDVKPDVDRAKEHAQKLMDQGNELSGLLRDEGEAADKALEAATSYDNIVKGINDSLKAAEEAVEAANKAKELSEGIDQDADASKSKSIGLLEDAKKAHSEVRPPLFEKLNTAKQNVDSVEKANKQTQDGLNELNAAMNRLQISALQPVAIETLAAANATSEAAQKTLNTIQGAVDRLPGDLDTANKIKLEIDEANNLIKHVHAQVDKARNSIPGVLALMGKIGNQTNRLRILGEDVGDKIAELKRKVALARDIANRIKLGIRFSGRSMLHLHNPEGLSQSATHNKIEMFFKTKEKDGILAYIGNEKGTHKKMKRTRTDDFMALEIREGKLSLTLNMGTERRFSLENERYVADDEWHKVIIDRTNNLVSLTVQTEDEEDRVNRGVIHGTKTVFNLDQELSKFYVGGVPADANLQDGFQKKGFDGCIEDLTFDDSPVGLWNFDNVQSVDGCVDRDKFVVLKPNTGLRFDGHGYAILKRQSVRFQKNVEINLEFRTYAKEGLLFLIGKETDYLSIELHEGRLICQYNLGSGATTLSSPAHTIFNDGRWHKIEVRRKSRNAKLTIDRHVIEGTSPGTLEDLSYTDDIFIGGFPGNHTFRNITNVDFEGCIDQLYIGKILYDLNKNREALGVVSGCPPKIARTVSFSEDSKGYVGMSTANISDLHQITFKFKTKEDDGILLYAANEQHSNYASLVLKDGILKFRMKPGGEVRSATSTKYNDLEWHYVTAVRTHDKLTLDIDDYDTYEAVLKTNDPVKITSLFIGGAPYLSHILREATGINRGFVGCIGDMTVNEDFQNFADKIKSLHGSFASCPLFIPTLAPFSTGTDIPFYALSGETETTVPFPTQPPRTRRPVTPRTRVTPLQPSLQLGDCALPSYSSESDHLVDLAGFRFGDNSNSRHEYALEKNKWNTQTDIKLDFKTRSSDGILFYLTDNELSKFISLHLKQGKVHLTHFMGNTKNSISSRETYNDGNWYTVHVKRNKRILNFLIKTSSIDIPEEYRSEISGEANIESASLLFIGSVSDKVAKAARNNIEASTLSIKACIREVYLFDKSATPEMFSTPSCQSHSEEGTFFSANKGYIMLSENFKIGYDIKFTLEIKPRATTGILLANHGKKDFLVIQLLNGTVKLTVDNGVGPFNITYKPQKENFLCDGKWHTVKVVKVRNLLMIEVDGDSRGPVSGPATTLSTDTNSPLYIGGINATSPRRGIETTSHYQGCIRKLHINEKLYPIEKGRKMGGVYMHFCPTN